MKKLLLISAYLLIGVAFANAQNVTDIRKVNFTNYTHTIGGKTVKFKNGLQVTSCSKDAEGIPTGDIWSIEKSNVKYGDLDGDGKDEAIISTVANICDGNMITNEAVLVYKLTKGKPVKLPEFEYFDEGCETGKVCGFARNPGVSASYDAKTKTIVIETFFATEDDAICCPSLHRETWYKWNGKAFSEIKKSKIEKVKTSN